MLAAVESLATASAAASTGSAELEAGASGASSAVAEDEGGREEDEGPTAAAAAASEEEGPLAAGIFPVSSALSKASSRSLVAARPCLTSQRRSPAAVSRASRRLGCCCFVVVEFFESRSKVEKG